jgi:DNA-binding response OmpR family regulator
MRPPNPVFVTFSREEYILNPAFTLLVEDDEYLNQTLSEILDLLDLKYMTIADGTVAYDQILRYQPELVLLDLQLPNTSGYDILQAIRHEARLDGTRVVVITANQFVNMADLQLADAVLIKPFTLNALSEAIELVSSPKGSRSPPHKPLSSGFK